MKYSVDKLVKMYNEYLTDNDFEVKLDISQPFDISTYNEYTYQKLMKQFDLLYNHTESTKLTEQFLKGE